jgi:hypothetical protein
MPSGSAICSCAQCAFGGKIGLGDDVEVGLAVQIKACLQKPFSSAPASRTARRDRPQPVYRFTIELKNNRNQLATAAGMSRWRFITILFSAPR